MIIAGSGLDTGILGRRRRFIQLLNKQEKRNIPKSAEKYPQIVLKYARSISKKTGLPMNQVLKSQPVQKYWDSLK